MVLNLIIIFVVIVVAGVIINGIEDYHERDFMSFRESLALADLPVITFYQENTKMNFLFDTGANLSVIDSSIASNIKTEPTNRVSKLSGIGGKIVNNPIVNITFQYKDRMFTEGFQVVDMSETFSAIKKSTGVTVHGMIGNAFMQRYKYVLDFDDMIAYSKR